MEIRTKIAQLQAKMKELPVKAPERAVYAETIRELEKMSVKLHVAEEQTCDGCQ